MKVFHCDHCGQLLFFENIQCVRCGRVLAYIPELADLASLDPSASTEGAWHSTLLSRDFRLCDNYAKYNVCNWALALDDPSTLCRACRLTTTIPNLARSGNDRLWYKLEVAKRRLIYTLDRLGLPVRSLAEDPRKGMVFEFREDVMTGHAKGVITVNIAEADDAERVKRRIELGEPYRTLLGHFRHESGHYYWDPLVGDEGPAALDAFRALFGDERRSYEDALAQHHREGAAIGWQDRYVSSYAAMHPWEDWAETWAHYLHMIDALETAAESGISIDPPREGDPKLTVVPNPVADESVSFERMLEGWTPITYVLNNLNRGLGNDDAYPFVLSTTSAEKLRFVHDAIVAHAER